MRIATNLGKGMYDFIRQQSNSNCSPTLEFKITINDIEYNAILIVETIRLTEGGRNLNGSRIDPVDRKFNKIHIKNIDPFLVKTIMNIPSVEIDGYCYYGGSNNQYEIIEDKIYTELRLIQCY